MLENQRLVYQNYQIFYTVGENIVEIVRPARSKKFTGHF